VDFDDRPAGSPGHPFYVRLNAILDEAGFDRFAEEQCRQFYAPTMGRPSLPPGRHFRLLLLGYLRRAQLGAWHGGRPILSRPVGEKLK
jgi:transposase